MSCSTLVPVQRQAEQQAGRLKAEREREEKDTVEREAMQKYSGSYHPSRRSSKYSQIDVV